jgi:hypothetical protein
VKSVAVTIACVLMLASYALAEPKVTIAVVGDSLADGMWGGLYRTVQKDKRYNVFRGAKNASGFTTSDLMDMLDNAIDAAKPDAVVMMIGVNDRKTFFEDGRAKALYGSLEWAELYKGRLARFMDHAAKRNVTLVWILLPNMRSADAAKDAALVNSLIIEVAKSRPLVMLMPTWELTSDGKGAYAPFFKDLHGEMKNMRASDGVHFTFPGYDVIADRVHARLRAEVPSFKVLTSGN